MLEIAAIPPFLSSFPNAIPLGKLIEFTYTSAEKFYLIAKRGEGKAGWGWIICSMTQMHSCSLNMFTTKYKSVQGKAV